MRDHLREGARDVRARRVNLALHRIARSRVAALPAVVQAREVPELVCR